MGEYDMGKHFYVIKFTIALFFNDLKKDLVGTPYLNLLFHR